MTDPRILQVCTEFGIEIIEAHRFPGVRQTRAVKTMERVLKKKGYDHFRFVMQSIAETANNYSQIDEYLILAMSDLVEGCAGYIEASPSQWFEALDAAPVLELQNFARKLPHSHHVLCGLLFERVALWFQDQGQLFNERVKA